MKLRASALAIVLAGTLACCYFAASRGPAHGAEQWFLDFLVANARESFTRDLPVHSADVVIVEYREEDKGEFSAWPPAPLDYILTLKRLAAHEPEVIAFTMPLRWTGEQAQFVAELRERLLGVPTVVLAYGLASNAGKADPEETEFFKDELPTLAQESDDSQQPGLHFLAVNRLPDKALRYVAQMGFVGSAGEAANATRAPFIATDGRRLTPSLAAQALTSYRKVPYASQRLRFGNGARLSLGDRFIIPLEGSGAMRLSSNPDVARVNALELMTPELGDKAEKGIGGTLGKHKVIVFALSPDVDGDVQAKALALGLALPEVRLASGVVIWSVVALACLLGFFQLRCRKTGALAFGFAVGVVGLMTSLLVFSSQLVWWSPTMPLAITLVSTAFCFLFPRKAGTTPGESAQAGSSPLTTIAVSGTTITTKNQAPGQPPPDRQA